MREIVLDTETTGLEPIDGHRIIEIGCIELMNHVATGRRYHVYIDPQRDVPEEAFAVHGLGREFLSQHPPFAEIVEDFLEFVRDDKLVIHNAEFDLRFLNHELRQHGRPEIPASRAVDTLAMARRRFPGAQASLDALCKRFEIDNSARELHGALLDCELLAEVYLELLGGRQPGLALSESRNGPKRVEIARRPRREPRPHAPTADETAAHAAMLAKLKSPIWEN